MEILRRVVRICRARDWWEHKLPCFLGVAYATAYGHHAPLARLFSILPGLVLAFIGAAAYVSVINDFTDEEDDRRAGKPNQLAGRSPASKASLLALCLLVGVTGTLLLPASPHALAFYAANWLVFTLYSVPPIRLKRRGVWGVLADASGGQLLPSLWMATWVAEAATGTWPVILAPLALWSYALGLRSILLHQMSDYGCDRETGVRTMVVQWGPERIRSLVGLVIFPIEAAALAWLIHATGVWWAWLLVAADLVMQWLQFRMNGQRPYLVQPSSRHSAAFFDYHQLFFPLTYIIALATREPLALVLIPMHLLAFPACSLRFAERVANLAPRLTRALYSRCIGRRHV